MGVVVFFFQAEDGIRDIGVTGVQTCALPIWRISAVCMEPLSVSVSVSVSVTGGTRRRGYLMRSESLVSAVPVAARSSARRGDRKSGVVGKRGDIGGGRNITKKKKVYRIDPAP